MSADTAVSGVEARGDDDIPLTTETRTGPARLILHAGDVTDCGGLKA